MSHQINELVKMRDIESLFELMTEDDDWMNQIDAAEGLVKLNDRRGYEFLLSASQSDDEEMQAIAREVLASPGLAGMTAEIEAEQKRERQVLIEKAKKRLQKGGKVYRYKMVYFPASEILVEDPLGEGFEVPALDDVGLDGWEVVNMIPRRRALLAGSVDDHFTGAYFLLKKEILPNESAELDNE